MRLVTFFIAASERFAGAAKASVSYYVTLWEVKEKEAKAAVLKWGRRSFRSPSPVGPLSVVVYGVVLRYVFNLETAVDR